MKKCPKCDTVNGSSADKCRNCGYDIKWLPDDGTESEVATNPPKEEPSPEDQAAHIDEADADQDKTGLADIHDQIEDIKKQLSKGSTVVDVNMPFGRMVMLFIKVLLAAVPAIIIVGFLFLVFWAFLGGLIFNVVFRGYGLH